MDQVSEIPGRCSADLALERSSFGFGYGTVDSLFIKFLGNDLIKVLTVGITSHLSKSNPSCLALTPAGTGRGLLVLAGRIPDNRNSRTMYPPLDETPAPGSDHDIALSPVPELSLGHLSLPTPFFPASGSRTRASRPPHPS